MTPKGLRYRETVGAEGTAQPGSHGRVLANLQGITAKRQMDLREYQALVAAQERYYTTFTPDTICRPAPISAVAESIARVHAELLLIHPFREGNGRLARWLADIMAVQAGYPIPDYAFVGRSSPDRRAHYIAAVSQGYAQNYLPLAAFFEEAIRRGGR